jgi:hypothetical protein
MKYTNGYRYSDKGPKNMYFCRGVHQDLGPAVVEVGVDRRCKSSTLTKNYHYFAFMLKQVIHRCFASYFLYCQPVTEKLFLYGNGTSCGVAGLRIKHLMRIQTADSDAWPLLSIGDSSRQLKNNAGGISITQTYYMIDTSTGIIVL